MEHSTVEKLDRFAEMLISENEKFNLTGLKTLEDVKDILIQKSILPLKEFSVPRGTRFVDIGTGSGIPGVVIGIMFPGFQGTLIEANGKKVEFIGQVIKELNISNIEVRLGRAEEIGHDPDLRKSFDWCFTRAFGPLYYSIEFGFPLLKNGGHLYIYSALKNAELSDGIISHIGKLGGTLVPHDKHILTGIGEEGLLMIKKRDGGEGYPRRFPIIKRESAKIPETNN